MRRALAIFLCAFALGCSDDDTLVVAAGPTGDPSLSFSDPSSDATAPTCVEVDDDFDFRLPMQIHTTELDLRPPGACLFAQCGHLQLHVQGVLNNSSAVPVIELLFRKLANRYHDGTPSESTGQPDLLEVVVEAVDSEGSILSDHSGEPLRDTLKLITVSECP